MIIKNKRTGKKPNGQGFTITHAWNEKAQHQWSCLEHHPHDGVGTIAMFINYGASGNAFYELQTLGYITEETRKTLFR